MLPAHWRAAADPVLFVQVYPRYSSYARSFGVAPRLRIAWHLADMRTAPTASSLQAEVAGTPFPSQFCQVAPVLVVHEAAPANRSPDTLAYVDEMCRWCLNVVREVAIYGAWRR